MNLDGRKKLVITILVGVVITTIIFTVFLIQNDASKNPYYIDPISGKEFFKDPNQAPENTGILLPIIGSTELTRVLSSKQFEEFRSKVTAWTKEQTTEKITTIYIVDGSFQQINSKNVSFKIKTAPYEITSDVKVGYVNTSVLYIWFNDKGPYIEPDQSADGD